MLGSSIGQQLNKHFKVVSLLLREMIIHKDSTHHGEEKTGTQVETY